MIIIRNHVFERVSAREEGASDVMLVDKALRLDLGGRFDDTDEVAIVFPATFTQASSGLTPDEWDHPEDGYEPEWNDVTSAELLSAWQQLGLRLEPAADQARGH